MPTRDDLSWFKGHFSAQIDAAVAGTPFDLDMVTAIACQETGYIWQHLRSDPSMTLDRILQLCVGDSIDARSVFPRSRAELENAPRGKEMFQVARAALEDMSKYVPGYKGVVRNPNKFCHGYGIFQYDIQFFIKDPDYFIDKKYEKFDLSLSKCIEELEEAMHRLRWTVKTKLTDMEKAAVAIAYNSGTYNASEGLKQGHFDGQKYYGQLFYYYMLLSRGVSDHVIAASVAATIDAPPAEPAGLGDFKIISTRPLNLRATPDIKAASLGTYPNGTQVNVLSRNGDWALVSVNLNNTADGYMWADYLAAA